MKIILIQLFYLTTLTAFAQPEIKVNDAKNHVGETVRICTKIYGGKYLEKDTLTLLNAGGNYPGAPLTIVIRAGAAKEFSSNPLVYFKGKDICVTGKIELFKEKPQIVIITKSQLVDHIKDIIDTEPK
ncbi:MAG: hypothetical protein ABI416_03945 [Ginsengibacter sp.]